MAKTKTARARSNSANRSRPQSTSERAVPNQRDGLSAKIPTPSSSNRSRRPTREAGGRIVPEVSPPSEPQARISLAEIRVLGGEVVVELSVSGKAVWLRNSGLHEAAAEDQSAVQFGIRGSAETSLIDHHFKGVAMALEPPRDADLSHLHPVFSVKLQAALADLAAQNTQFRFVEGFRTVDRQQWLFGSGRPTVVPYGRVGKVVTERDGVNRLSNHQGDGTVGSGKGADCYPVRNGKVEIPPASDPIWRAYAEAVVRQGLRPGLDFPTLVDAPHCEL